ncbi:HTH-type transcriptional regulator [Rhynchospora pubera]|uniref:HTH-type transcriptional regulator n=1 Tax=Rhynchospora pubera TaxID=906938 RepID=A0AAV8CJP4_9POAL|nr:HTH-type transcriptional regulator [Rhynchospora pubera]KAJ4755764.1 HTH-type transcriptional regulator [Rhynchospora pubera]
MGACNSCESTAVSADTSSWSSPPTAKVVLPDGSLQEFSWPIKASHVIQKASTDHSACFLSSSDHLEPGCHVSAIRADSELQLGQLYFLLPTSMLRRRLGSDEMAALAVRASAALVGHNKGHLDFPCNDCSWSTEDTLCHVQAKRKGRSSRGSSKGRDFETELGAIPE